MHDSPRTDEKPEWVVWNGSAGILTKAWLGRIESGPDGRRAWLDHPFDMVGPFSFDELESTGRISFAACMVMSVKRWQADQVELRREAYEQRRAARARIEAEYGGHFDENGSWFSSDEPRFDETEHREALNLPADETLDESKIKTAFRRLAQKLHPDVGGSHEAFLRITEARNALLARFS